MDKNGHGGDIYSYQNVLDFSANTSPLGLPGGVRQAVIDSLLDADIYPDVHCRVLKGAIAAAHHLPSEWICCGNGAADLIYALVLAKKPKKALLLAPTFGEYEQALAIVDAKISYEVLDESEDFCCTDQILEQLNEDIDMVFLCQPNNPTGKLIEPELMAAILKKCRQSHCLVVVDECFMEFVSQAKDYSVEKYLPEMSDLFILKAFTKCYGMASLRLGYGLCQNSGLLAQMAAVTQPWNVSGIAQAAGIAALKEQDYLKELKALIAAEKPYLETALADLGFKVFRGTANYIFFKGPKNLKEKCLLQGILIRDCSNYQALSEGYYRIAVRTHKENEMLVTALKKEAHNE